MALASTLEALADRLPLVLITLVVAALAALIPSLLARQAFLSIPLIGAEAGGEEKRRAAFVASGKNLYFEGYQQFRDGLFRITTTRRSPTVVVSPRFLSELQRLPDDVLSMTAAVDEGLEVKYTKLRSKLPIVPNTIKSHLTPSLPRLNPAIYSEVIEAFDREFPPCADWTEVNINNKLLRIVAMVSGRVFIGPELCHDEQYLNSAINYTTDVINAIRAIGKIPVWLRFWKAPRLPEVKSINLHIDQAMSFLRPVIRARMDAAKAPNYEKPDDMLQWLIDMEAGKIGSGDVKELAHTQLGLTFAAIHTTTSTATNAFYNLVTMPHLITELRDEITTALAESGGVITSRALQRMKKLDSFLRETMRADPMGFASFTRKTLRPITLSNGQVIPAGVLVEVATIGLNSDPALNPEGDQFDALRYYRRRNGTNGTGSAVDEALNQFVSVNQGHLSFGFGRHACPGRFFAANEIKMIMATSLLRYDVKMADEHQARYPNIEFAQISMPDPSKQLLFKRRSDNH